MGEVEEGRGRLWSEEGRGSRKKWEVMRWGGSVLSAKSC